MAKAERHALALSVQYADARLKAQITRAMIRRWVQAALLADAELAVRIVSAEEGQALNRDYRGRDYATNVLTFAYNESADDPVLQADVVQADIVLCSEVLEREAAEQGISLAQHAAHLVVHGVLHAQGYDHEDEDEAAEMEQLETEILAGLGLPDPYRER
jgi:probable rRNA maturation factor